jgi:general stress protein 26
MADKQNPVEHLWSLIKDVKVAMLTTEVTEGWLRSRPMATQQAEFTGDLWFFTRESSGKVAEARRHEQVNLSYAKPSDNQYVSVSGTAELVHDAAKNKQLWNPIYKAWFPKGLEDPELALLKVHVERAEFWDSPTSTMVQIAGFLKAMASGKSYQPGPGEHGTVEPGDVR